MRLRRLSRTVLVVVTMLSAVPQAGWARGPEGIADLAEQVTDAVVNIATTQKVSQQKSVQPPQLQLPPGSPFQEFFEEFFKQRGQNDDTPDANRDRPQRRSSSLGSGFVVDASGIIITNNHVINDADEIMAVFTDGTRLKAELIGKDAKTDLAVLKVTPQKPLKALKFGNSDSLRVGDWVVAIGNPFGLGGTVTAGIVSARNRDINAGPYDNFIQTDAAINRGNSGGPLFNLAGEVVGINTAIISPSGGSIGIGFAIPAATALPVIEQLREFRETRRGWLGVRIQPVTDDIAKALNMGTPRGALIAGIDDKGPAKPAGIEAGDVVIKFDGKDIKDMRDLPRTVAETPIGKEVPVVVLRNGQELTRKVKVGRLEDAEKSQNASVKQGESNEAQAGRPKALGMELSALTDDLRKKYGIKDGLKGVVITSVERNSAAAERNLAPGTLIVKIGDQDAKTAEDTASRLEAVKKEKQAFILLLVSTPNGDQRFVPLPLS